MFFVQIARYLWNLNAVAGMSLKAMDRFDEAITHFNAAISIETDDADDGNKTTLAWAHTAAAETHLAMHNSSGIVHHLTISLAAKALRDRDWLLLSEALCALSQWTDA